MRISTVCSNLENIYYYLKILVYTLKNSGFDKKTTPLYVYQDGMTDELKEYFNKMWNVKFIDVSREYYTSIHKPSPKFWSLETFNPDNYDKVEDVIFLDSDILIVNDITKLRDYCKGNIAMHHEHRRPCFNSGVMCINKKYITKDIYDKLVTFNVDYAEFGHDQQVINKSFAGEIVNIEAEYNVFNDGEAYNEGVKIVHYIHKPDKEIIIGESGKLYLDIWNNTYKEMESIHG